MEDARLSEVNSTQVAFQAYGAASLRAHPELERENFVGHKVGAHTLPPPSAGIHKGHPTRGRQIRLSSPHAAQVWSGSVLRLSCSAWHVVHSVQVAEVLVSRRPSMLYVHAALEAEQDLPGQRKTHFQRAGCSSTLSQVCKQTSCYT